MEENVEKFKLSLLNLEKRIIDLEALISELAENVKKFDPKVFERVEELEDVVMATNLVLTDLKKKIEEKVTEEDIKRIGEMVKSRIYEEMAKEIKDVKNETLKLKSEIESLAHSSSSLLSDFNKLKSRIEEVEEVDLQKLVSEISSIRNETMKELRGIKEQIEKLDKKTSAIDISLLSSKFNSLKENVDYLLNRKVELDMKIKTLEEALSRIIGKEPGIFIEGLENIVERLKNVEKRLKVLESGILQLQPTSLDERISELLRRISLVEGKLVALEKVSVKKGPVILE